MNELASIPGMGWIVIGMLGFLVFAIIITTGIRFKLGDKELVVGGIFKWLFDKDADGELSKELKKITDQIDADESADLIKVIEGTNDRLLEFIPLEGCEFSFDRLAAIIKGELYSRKNYNDLKNKLTAKNWIRYRDDIIKEIRFRYELFLSRAALTSCGIKYQDWRAVAGNIRGLIEWWRLESLTIIKKRKQEKVSLYNEYAQKFKTKKERIRCCLSHRDDNISYIRALEVQA